MIEPLSARATIGLMRALDAAGDRAAALQHARIHARLLEAELGSVPDSGVSALAARLRSEPAPPAGVAPSEVRASAVARDAPAPPPVPAAPRRMGDGFRIAPHSITFAGLVLVGAALLGWVTLGDRPGRRHVVAGRFVVAPLENLTGERSLDHIGRVSADWLAQAIAESDSVDVVSPAAVAILLRDASGSMAEQRDLLARATGAQRVLSGGFARRGRDSLVLQANVLDARDGRVIWKLDPAAAPVGDPTIAIQALREQLLGAVVSDARPRARVRGIRPPRYSAYLEYLAAAELYERHMDFLAARAYLERVVGLDSTFAAAWTMLLGTYMNRSEYAGAEEVLRRMERVRGSFSPTDLDYFEFARGHAHLDHAAMLPAVQRLAARDSNPVMLYLIGWSGVALLRPRDAVPALERADSLMVANGWRYQPATLGEAYHQAGAYDRELGSLQRGRRLFPDVDGYPGWQLRAFAGLRRPAAAIALADTILLGITDSEGARAEQLLAAAAEFRVHDDSVTARRLTEKAMDWYAAHPLRRPSSNRERREGRTAYLTGRHELAVRLLERAARDTNDLDAAGYLALTHVSRGGRERARSMADSIGALRREWSFGRHTRWRAAILGALGERDLAVELLRQASRERDDRAAWHSDPSLDRLRSYHAFQELIRPTR